MTLRSADGQRVPVSNYNVHQVGWYAQDQWMPVVGSR